MPKRARSGIGQFNCPVCGLVPTFFPELTDEDADEFGTDGLDGVAAVSGIYIVADDRVQKDDEAGKDHQEPDDQ